MTQTFRFRFDKLIRDQMSVKMRKLGIDVMDRVMNTEEFQEKLKDKLHEEVTELCTAQTPEDVLEELADVYEVLLSIAKLHQFTAQEIENHAHHKRQEKGGFDARLYTDYVTIAANNPSLAYYKSRPDQYPEL